MIRDTLDVNDINDKRHNKSEERYASNNTFDYSDVNFSRRLTRKMIHHTLYDYNPIKKSKCISKLTLGNNFGST